MNAYNEMQKKFGIKKSMTKLKKSITLGGGKLKYSIKSVAVRDIKRDHYVAYVAVGNNWILLDDFEKGGNGTLVSKKEAYGTFHNKTDTYWRFAVFIKV